MTQAGHSDAMDSDHAAVCVETAFSGSQRRSAWSTHLPAPTKRQFGMFKPLCLAGRPVIFHSGTFKSVDADQLRAVLKVVEFAKQSWPAQIDWSALNVSS